MLDRFQWMDDGPLPVVPDSSTFHQKSAERTIRSLKHYIPGTPSVWCNIPAFLHFMI